MSFWFPSFWLVIVWLNLSDNLLWQTFYYFFVIIIITVVVLSWWLLFDWVHVQSFSLAVVRDYITHTIDVTTDLFHHFRGCESEFSQRWWISMSQQWWITIDFVPSFFHILVPLLDGHGFWWLDGVHISIPAMTRWWLSWSLRWSLSWGCLVSMSGAWGAWLGFWSCIESLRWGPWSTCSLLWHLTHTSAFNSFSG